MICGVSKQKRTDFKQWLTIFCKLFKWNSSYLPNKESVFSIFADDYNKSLPIENDLNVILYKDRTRMLNPQCFFSFCVNIADMVKLFCISLLMLEVDWILRCVNIVGIMKLFAYHHYCWGLSEYRCSFGILNRQKYLYYM